ncbi:DUF6616 family protein [Deinobacterium chartae]|uniref:DUF6616 family protein n=1 Tax=Deinobacterium chartae TaxID=521158 RepID=UPI003CCDDA17
MTELYSPKPARLALDQNGHRQFFGAIGSGMQAPSSLEVEAVALGATGAATRHAAPQKFCAIRRVPMQ